MRDYPGFIGPSHATQSALADVRRLINYYVEPPGAQYARAAAYPTPGFSAFVTVPETGSRALFAMNDRVHGVVGGTVREIFADRSTQSRGTVAQDGNLAYITTNGSVGNQALVASGSNAYVLNLTTNTLSAAVLVSEARQIGMLDTFGIAFANGKVRLSNANDFNTWDPTQFALRSSSPDNWKAMLVNAPDVWLIGGQSGDVWYDKGDFPFPLAPRPGATFKWGIAATASIAAAGDSVLWLSSNEEGDGIVVRARGYVPVPVSDDALAAALTRYRRDARIDDAEGLAYQYEGHTFYVLRFPSADATWAYDLKTGYWFECGKWDDVRGRFGAWAPRVHCFAFGKHLVGDAVTGTIAIMDGTYGTEIDGKVIRRVLIPSPLWPSGRKIIVDRLEVGVEPATATVSGAGADPQMMLRVSYTTGKTWGNERMRSTGRIGQVGKKVFWTRCGSSEQSWLPELTVSDPVPYRLVFARVAARGMR